MSSLLQHLPALLTFFRRTLAVVAGVTFIATAAGADTASKGDIVAATVHGDVRATMGGVTSPLYAGAILQLPATLRTGANGALELRQGPTTIAAAANTELEIPESAAEQGLIERVIQIKGNAFYNVGKRDRTRLRVETPYLVAVIKGTQFNVASQEDSTTIALFEGRLEVRAADESDVVDLHAGEIAIRNRNDPSIRVLRMTATVADGAPRDHGTASPLAGGELDLTSSNNPHQQATPVDSMVDGNFSPASGIDAGASGGAQIDLGSAKAGLQVETELGAANASVGATTDVSFGGTGIDASIGAGVDSAVAGADLGVGVSAGGGDIAVAADVGADLAGVSAGAAVDAGIDLSSTPAVNVDAGLSAGGGDLVAASVDAGVSTTTTDLGASLDVGGTALDVDTTVDVPNGDVSAGVDIADVIDVGVDLGSGTTDINIGGTDTGGGLLGGLLNRRGKN